MSPSPYYQVAVPGPFFSAFDYLPPSNPTTTARLPVLGDRVWVPLSRRRVMGVVVALSETSTVPSHKLRPIHAVIDQAPVLTPACVQRCQWLAQYYHYPLGEVIQTMLPAAIFNAKRDVWRAHEGYELTILRRQALESGAVRPQATQSSQATPSSINTAELINKAPTFSLNTDQQAAVKAITDALNTFQVMVLAGVTGSGKTEVYLHAMTTVLAKGQHVLILVPEIALTPQTVARFQARFNVPIEVLHSKVTEANKKAAWLGALTNQVRIVIGTRSAVFVPLQNLGLIICDESHDLSFKQQQGLRYHARDVAIKRAQLEQIPVVLGSATPTLETLYNVAQGRYRELRLPNRTGQHATPPITCLDMRDAPLVQGLSRALLDRIGVHLNQGHQVMVFLNRRGYAPTVICHHCGWVATCPHCDARLIMHQGAQQLRCHHCDYRRRPNRICETCQQAELMTLGFGTERLEQVLAKYFPAAKTIRLDRDQIAHRDDLERALTAIQSRAANLIIGTQMLAKGHHFPQLSLVAVVDIDQGLFSPDFRAVERLAQLLIQVSGRAGRADVPGEVVLQTHHPDHPYLQALCEQRYEPLAQALLRERAQFGLPPYGFLALFRAESPQSESAAQVLRAFKQVIMSWQRQHTLTAVQLLGPTPAMMERLAGRYRYQLLLKASQRSLLQQLLRDILPELRQVPMTKQTRWVLDVDPMEMV